MRHRFLIPAAGAALVGLFMIPDQPPGDEGMWLFNNPPRAQLKKYGFEPTDAVARPRAEVVASASTPAAPARFVSRRRPGDDQPPRRRRRPAEARRRRRRTTSATASTPRPATEEIKCKELELNVLHRHRGRDRRGERGRQAGHRRRPRRSRPAQAKIAEIEKAAADETKNIRADVVTLYDGGAVPPLPFKKYTDVRLVFAPEKQIAFFGGDPDNFEYPRYDLDVCFFRVYENDKPVKIEHYLKWSPDGAKDGELVVRLRPPRPHQPAEHGRRAGVPARHRLPVPAAAAQPAAKCCSTPGATAARRTRQQARGRAVRRPEQPQGPHRRPRPGCSTRR